MGVKLFFTLILPKLLQRTKDEKIIEFLISGFIYILLGFLCLFFLYQHFSQIKLLKQTSFDFNKWFWISISIWCLYHATFQIIYFGWVVQYYYIFGICLDSVLLLIPSSLFIVIISETLFVYRNPGILVYSFSRILFVVFFIVYLIFGVVAACFKYIDDIDFSENDFLHLWLSCYDFLMACFIMMPSYKLIQALSTPVVLLEDSKFIKKMILEVVILCFIYLLCSISNILSYCGVNPAINALKRNFKDANNRLPSFKKRYIYILLDIFFNLDVVVMLILGVKLIRQHDLSYVDEVFETQARSDYETNPGN